MTISSQHCFTAHRHCSLRSAVLQISPLARLSVCQAPGNFVLGELSPLSQQVFDVVDLGARQVSASVHGQVPRAHGGSRLGVVIPTEANHLHYSGNPV